MTWRLHTGGGSCLPDAAAGIPVVAASLGYRRQTDRCADYFPWTLSRRRQTVRGIQSSLTTIHHAKKAERLVVMDDQSILRPPEWVYPVLFRREKGQLGTPATEILTREKPVGTGEVSQ